MRRLFFFVALIVPILTMGSGPPAGAANVDHEVIRAERAALDRWGRGDPDGFLETYAPDVTYFDVGTERRIDGHAAMTEYYRPYIGKIKIASYDMLNPKVQQHGDVAILTYNLVSNVVQPDETLKEVRWNSTAVYARADGKWKLTHSHWSLTAPPCLRGTM